jgi:hypothetical protein
MADVELWLNGKYQIFIDYRGQASQPDSDLARFAPGDSLGDNWGRAF